MEDEKKFYRWQKQYFANFIFNFKHYFIKKISSYKSFYLIIFFVLHSFFLSAQKATKIELLSANSLEFDKRYGDDVKRLIGNVSFRQENTYLYCDSAYLYSNSNSIDAYGHVHISSETVDINSDVLIYNGNSKLAQLNRNVKMTDNKMILTTEYLTYNLNSKVANYWTGGKIVELENVLTSTIGYYYSDKHDFFFKDAVKLVNPQYIVTSDTLMHNTETEISYFYGPTKIISNDNIIYCENGWYDTKRDIAQFNKHAWYNNKEQTLSGDSLYYDRTNGIGKAFNNITLTDTIQKTVINGNFAFYDEKKGKSFVTGNAHLAQIIDVDTLFLHADTLRTSFDSTRTEKALFAFHKAKFFKSDLQGISDSLVYTFKDSIIALYHQPVLWTKENQFTADTISIIVGKKEIKKMFLYNYSFIVAMEDTMQDTLKNMDSIRFNQVKGKNMIGYFEKNDLRKITVIENAETIYFVREDTSALIGINKVESTNMNIYISERRINNIVFISLPIATLYPKNELTPKELKLNDFKWYRNKRPMNKQDIFK